MTAVDRYQEYLCKAGSSILFSDGVWWQNYKRILIPAYLPHLVPAISLRSAESALAKSNAIIARWTGRLDRGENTRWWFVICDGVYDRGRLSSNTRSKLSRGKRRLLVRPLSVNEVLADGYLVCAAAAKTYGSTEFLPPHSDFVKRVSAANLVAGAVEYWGVFEDAKLVAFSENHIQDGAVFLESIWYDPVGLSNYSSYVLIDSLLEEYLNNRGFRYVSDGSRNIYHETGVHDFLIEKFGFRRAGASMHLCYTPVMGLAMRFARPLASVFSGVAIAQQARFSRRLKAVLLQDSLAEAVR